MKKLYSIIAIAAMGVVANAQTQVVNDTFSYTGALDANGWVKHSGSNSGELQASGGTANLVAGNTEDVNIAFSTPYTIATTGTSHAQMTATINVASATGLTTAAAGEYFLMFGGTAGTTVTYFYGRVYIKGSATGYTLGIANGAAGTATFGTEIPYGTPANITVDYYVNTSMTPTTYATMQINSQPLLTNNATTTAAPASLASVALRQAGSATVGTGNISIDNLVATTYPTTTLGVATADFAKNIFVKNTQVSNEINFGAKSDVKIYNMNGQIVKSASVNSSRPLNVEELNAGMYIVTGTVNGAPVSTKILKK